MMHEQSHNCPACSRQFRNIQDYPYVRIVSFKRMPIPEAIDYTSGTAAEKRLSKQRAKSSGPNGLMHDGINMTPKIELVCNTDEVLKYLTYLSTLSGHEIIPNKLLPPFKAHGYFKWAYPVSDTGIYLSMTDSAPPIDGKGIAEIQLHCVGPNLGSAGGPTLQRLGTIALLHYQGLLTKPFR